LTLDSQQQRARARARARARTQRTDPYLKKGREAMQAWMIRSALAPAKV